MLCLHALFLAIALFCISVLCNSNFPAPGNATYDYIVVGGGTAGLAIASRLAADPSLSVAVIEAGGFYEHDNGNRSIVPGYCAFNVGTDANDTNPKVDWGFITSPQQGAGGRKMHYARGRTLGGSSARNFMYYHRPTIGSAQMWADEVDDQSYTFSELLPYYEKAVQYTPPSFAFPNSTNRQDDRTLSGHGPVQISMGGYNDPLATWAAPAFASMEQSPIAGFQSGHLLGSAYFLYTIDPKTAARSSSESSYLTQARQTTKIAVYNNTLAERILISGDRATEVAVNSSGVGYILAARKEVIISAGAFQSPQLLMVSGIGPKAILAEHEIPVVKDLPGVGQNLWDHPFFAIEFRINLLTGSAAINNASIDEANVKAYQTASGPLTVSGAGVLGWEKLPNSARAALSPESQKALAGFPADWPELEFLPNSAVIGNGGNFLTQDPADGHNYASLAVAMVAPLSRGNITIQSSSMADPPVINPNWLTDPADAEMAIAAFKRTRVAWAAMHNLTIGEEYFPGPSVQSDQEILQFVRDNLIPVWHPSSTCKMGKSNDSMAVVDTQAKIYGFQNLRVVDASAFPFLPPGHPQSTVYALAEKIADIILKGHPSDRMRRILPDSSATS